MRQPGNSNSGVATDINAIAAFLAKRDMEALTEEDLLRCCGAKQADVLIVLGNSLLGVTEAAARARRAGLSARLMIVGGRGHSTPHLVEAIKRSEVYRDIPAEGRTEAEILLEVAAKAGSLDPGDILLEKESTNCGNNAAYARDVLLHQGGKMPRTAILMQDPTMQLRTHMSFLQAWQAADQPCRFLSYAAFVPEMSVDEDGKLVVKAPHQPAVWSAERLLSLLMGEIPRLRDDEHGYGPRGKGFIPHVEIPGQIEHAYSRLLTVFGDYTARGYQAPKS